MGSTVQQPSLVEAALDYARRGWPVHPCSARDKTPLLPQDREADGKPIKGSGGVNKATTDEEQIISWWMRWPDAMIGVATGHGMFVVDFDPRIDTETGEEWTLDSLKAALEEQLGVALPATLAVRTQSGGVHLYFATPDDGGEPIRNRGNLPRHVDVRGKGGYVIAAPSVMANGARYRWLRDDATAEIAAAPEALIRILRETGRPAESARTAAGARPLVDVDEQQRKYAMRALDSEVRELEATPRGGGRYGGRNQGAYSAAFNLGMFVPHVLSESMVRGVLLDVVRGFDPGAYDKHAAAIDNGLANGMAKPRDLSAVGARSSAHQARDRDSGRSSSPSVDDGPPIEAYADDFARSLPAPGPDDGGDNTASFHDGTASDATPARGSGGRIRALPNAEMDRRCAFFPMTDLGNAERFRARHGWRFRFCNELGWFIWDGRRWALMSEEKDKVPGPVSLAVFETVRAIRNEADLIEASGVKDDDEDTEHLDFIVAWRGTGDNKVPVYFSEKLREHAKSSEGSSRISCIAGLAKAFADVAIRADAMDADRMAINVLNGTLRLVQNGKRWALVEGVLKPVTTGDRWGIVRHDHRPDDLISKVANVVFDPAAASPEYDTFLAVVQPDEKVRRFLHQWGGLSLTGDISEQKLAFFHGKGRNGKSTLVDAWSDVAGDYGGSVGIETFLDQGKGRKGGEATPDLARLPGIRFLRTSEPEKGAKLAEALIKLITGGELIDARHLNKGFFSFLPSFKVTISGNHKPKITGHDDGIWRRVMLVPWDVQIDKDKVDRGLPEKLRRERSGILNRLLAGLLDQRAAGLVEPDSVLAATAKYREQSDQLGRFLVECTRPGPDDTTRAKSSVLFQLFTAWCKATGAGEWQPQGFSKAMEDRGFEKITSNGVKWLGIEMIKAPEDFVDAPSGASGERARDDPGPRYDDDIPL